MKEKYLRKRFGDSLTCKGCGADPFDKFNWFTKLFFRLESTATFLYETLMEGDTAVTMTCEICGEICELTKHDLPDNNIDTEV